MSVASTTFPGANPTGLEYVDGIIWGTSWDISTNVGGPAGTITYSFADASVSGFKTMRSYEMQAFRTALSIIETFIPIDFVEVDFLAPSGTPYYENISFGLVTTDDLDGGLGFHQVPGDTPPYQAQFGISTLFGLFAYDTPLFSREALVRGGEGFATILHEILHGLGLAHPHDDGGSSSVFAGVTEPFGDYGTDGQNQGVYTIMSYNSGYAEVVPVVSYTYGGIATPMALDIAALQAIYGTKNYREGDNVYTIKGSNGVGTFWQSIWDTGGTDTISAAGVTRRVVIDLRAADLEGNDAGGNPSFANGIRGGFTIANTVEIENAIGGSGNDLINGNALNNQLEGLNGNDILSSGSGADRVFGGNGNDTIIAGGGNDSAVGGNGSDVFVFRQNDGNDYINGGSGADWVRFSGQVGATVDLTNVNRQDTGYGQDIIRSVENVDGTSQGDQFVGNEYANTMIGRGGNDNLDGSWNHDRLFGNTGNDTLIGGGGHDTLLGGLGDDILIGGLGRDFLRGDAGADTFVFNATRESTATTTNADVIMDFQHGVDKIDLSAMDSSTLLSGDEDFVFRGQGNFFSVPRGEIFYRKVDLAGTANDKTFIFIDTDADRGAEMVIELRGLHNLTADDFIL